MKALLPHFLILCAALGGGSASFAQTTAETNAAPAASRATVPVAVRSVFVDDVRQGRDPFFPNSRRRMPAVETPTIAAAAPQPDAKPKEATVAGGLVEAEKKKEEAPRREPSTGKGAGPTPGEAPQLRSNFAETAYFIPQLLTEADGGATIEFTAPDSVTSWSVWVHALTKDLRGGSLRKEARTVKELLVRPYLPRFFREGDRAELRVVVNNSGAAALAGTLELAVLDAPVTVDTFVRLARGGFFDGLPIHRVVPDFVIQAGDPRGDGEGGPGFTIRDEINQLPYLRGAVGMALDWADTGGSQFFITHSPQPHLDGRYTVFGRVVAGMDVVDAIQQWDVIRRVRVWDGSSAN